MPRDPHTTPEPGIRGKHQIASLFARIPSDVRNSFSESQRRALDDAAEDLQWGRHSVDLRLSVPFFVDRFYLTIVGGRERRDEGRRADDRRKHPILTFGNRLFLLAIGTVVGLAIFAAIQLLTLSVLRMSGTVPLN